jgi:hypothetical protein
MLIIVSHLTGYCNLIFLENKFNFVYFSEIWDRYLEFESQVGDLPSILKVDKRRREALAAEFGDLQTLLLIDRYKFLNLVPCLPDQLKLLGYTVGCER